MRWKPMPSATAAVTRVREVRSSSARTRSLTSRESVWTSRTRPAASSRTRAVVSIHTQLPFVHEPLRPLRRPHHDVPLRTPDPGLGGPWDDRRGHLETGPAQARPQPQPLEAAVGHHQGEGLRSSGLWRRGGHP